MRTFTCLTVLLISLVLAPVLDAQILDPNGKPNSSYPDLYGWYNASDGVNGPGTPPNGTPVTSWEDLSWQAHHLPRVSGALAPVFMDNVVAGNPAVEFFGDGGVWGDKVSEFGSLVGPKTIFVVSEVDMNDSGTSYIFDSSSGTGRNALLTGQSATPDTWQIFTGTGVALGVPIIRDKFQVHSVVLDYFFQEHFIDGVSQYTGLEDLQSLDGFILGTRYTVSNSFTGNIAEVLVYSSVLSSVDRQAVEGYLADRYIVSPLEADTSTISQGTGGKVNFTLNAGLSNANRFYLMLGSVTGTSPGTILPKGMATLPLNWDVFTNLIITFVNAPNFGNFFSMLDGSGKGTAQFDTGLPLPPATVGIYFYFAYALFPPWDFASNAVAIEVIQ